MNTRKVKVLAEQNGLPIIEDTIKINESGVDFQVAHAEDANGDNWILRVPRRPESMRHADKENQALGIIQRHASFQVPDWSIYSADLIAYKQLKGVPAATIDMELQAYVWSFDETNVPANYYETLGKALANLHNLPEAPFKKTGIEIIEASELITSMKQRMERVKQAYDVNPSLWDRWQAWLSDDSLWPKHVGVRHGDMHPGHILIDPNHRVTGFIDWTEVGIGDVSIDFMSHQMLFGKEGLAKIIAAYDNAGGRTWSRMEDHITELLTTSGITVAEYAEVSGLKDMHEAAVHMLAADEA